MTRWVRAGLLAAVFSGAPSTALGLLRRQDLLASTEAVGAVVLPASASRWRRVAAGGAAHLVISLLWARLMAGVLGGRSGVAARGPATGMTVGAAFGLAIAALDLGVVGRWLRPIRELPAAPQVADHLAYGALVGWVLSRPD